MSDHLLECMAGMAIFARVVEARSFSGAARTLGLTKSAVSKRISRLESLLGMQLLRRTTRSLSLTEAGRALYDRAAQAVALCHDASGAVAELTERPNGLLRVTAPVTFGRLRIAPLLSPFLAAHPQVQVQLVLLDRPVDLADEGFDVAIRLTRTLPADVVARRLASVRYVLCAAKGAFARSRLPRTPEELAGVPCLRYGGGETGSVWCFDDGEGNRRVRVSGPLWVNNSEALRDAVLAGTGVALLPDFVVEQDLREGRLRRLLHTWTPRAPFGTEACAVWLPDRHMPPKMRAFVDFLQISFNYP